MSTGMAEMLRLSREDCGRLRQENMRLKADLAAVLGCRLMNLQNCLFCPDDLCNDNTAVQIQKEQEKEIERLREELDQLKREHASEVEEFNAGFECAMNGGSARDEPFDTPHDQWLCGFAWGQYCRDERSSKEE